MNRTFLLSNLTQPSLHCATTNTGLTASARQYNGVQTDLYLFNNGGSVGPSARSGNMYTTQYTSSLSRYHSTDH